MGSVHLILVDVLRCPTNKRKSRALSSSADANPCQSAKPRASCNPVARRSRVKSRSCEVLSCCPKKFTPVSLSWCASSNTTTRTLGSNSAIPDSRTAKSAKNKWWLITTISAASASRRALLTWQFLNAGHCEPKQFSRLEVIHGIKDERSSRPGNSAKSPVWVVRAQVSTLANKRTTWRSGKEASCLAICILWVHK